MVESSRTRTGAAFAAFVVILPTISGSSDGGSSSPLASLGLRSRSGISSLRVSSLSAPLFQSFSGRLMPLVFSQRPQAAPISNVHLLLYFDLRLQRLMASKFLSSGNRIFLYILNRMLLPVSGSCLTTSAPIIAPSSLTPPLGMVRTGGSPLWSFEKALLQVGVSITPQL